MTIYAIVGNRTNWTYEEIKTRLDALDMDFTNDIIISGGAIGVDNYAEQYARENSIMCNQYLPNFNEPIPDRYFNRNRNIAWACDILIAFDKKKGRSGTKNTLKFGRLFKKQIILHTK